MYSYEIMLICTDIGFERFYEIYQERAEVFFTQNKTGERRALIENRLDSLYFGHSCFMIRYGTLHSKWFEPRSNLW